jgi:hypothetical protein
VTADRLGGLDHRSTRRHGGRFDLGRGDGVRMTLVGHDSDQAQPLEPGEIER